MKSVFYIAALACALFLCGCKPSVNFRSVITDSQAKQWSRAELNNFRGRFSTGGHGGCGHGNGVLYHDINEVSRSAVGIKFHCKFRYEPTSADPKPPWSIDQYYLVSYGIPFSANLASDTLLKIDVATNPNSI